MKYRRALSSGAGLALPLLLATSLSAAADEGSEADGIAQVIAKAAPGDEVVVEADEATADSFDFVLDANDGVDEAKVLVEVPANAADPVVFDTGAADDFHVSLPTEVEVHDAQVAEDGTVVYADAGGGAHAAVQTLDDGSVRLQTVLEGDAAPKQFTYELGDLTPVLLDDGSVELTEVLDDGVVAVVGTIDAPWAVDATGAAVATRYSVENYALTQHVETTDSTTYPVTADPKVSFGTKIYIRYSRAETVKFAGYSPYLTISAAVCSFLSGGWATGICIATLGSYSVSVDQAFQRAKNTGKCMEITAPYPGGNPVKHFRWNVITCR